MAKAKTKKDAGASVEPASVTRMELEVRIDAKPARVWESLTSEIAGWWPRDFCVGGEKARMTLESRVGGRMFEDWGGGAGAMWGTVMSLNPHQRLEIVGHLTPDFGGPAVSMIQFTLKADRGGAATVLSLSDSLFGRTGEKAADSLSQGWKMLFDALKAYAEGRGATTGAAPRK